MLPAFVFVSPLHKPIVCHAVFCCFCCCQCCWLFSLRMVIVRCGYICRTWSHAMRPRRWVHNCVFLSSRCVRLMALTNVFCCSCCRWRPYRVECTGSLPTSEVKRRRARLVLGWGTAREDLRVLPAFYISVVGRAVISKRRCDTPCQHALIGTLRSLELSSHALRSPSLMCRCFVVTCIQTLPVGCVTIIWITPRHRCTAAGLP